MREQGKQRKLIDRWAEDKNPVGFDPDYKYDKSAYKPCEIVHTNKSMEEVLDLLKKEREEKAKKKGNIDHIKEI